MSARVCVNKYELGKIKKKYIYIKCVKDVLSRQNFLSIVKKMFLDIHLYKLHIS